MKKSNCAGSITARIYCRARHTCRFGAAFCLNSSISSRSCSGLLAVWRFWPGMPQLGFAIFVVIVLNGLFAFLQEYRAEKAGERLRDLLPRRVMVRREGKTQSIDAIELVPDDVVVLNRRRPHLGGYALSRSPRSVH